MSDQLASAQRAVCRRVGADFVKAASVSKAGIGRGVRRGDYPINGLRHPPQGDTCGWYVWVGQGNPPEDADFFAPLHVSHLRDRLPEVEQYLALAPGWRFLIAPDHEDIWFDESLLDI